uniref:SWIM-type domain-containing protein n=1 Tax=Lactuca sativa TaxID=4236 RepID=A0A9R1VWK7_LACSA|nr:hypothetical protein LSAT_V11C400213330 [Lactuca sativa]
MERDLKTWCKAFFETNRACDAYENGVSKSFNSVMDDARKRPLITMLEEIIIYVMERLCIQKSKGSSWGDLNICPSIRLKLFKIKELQRFWRVVPSGYQEFEVRLGYDAYAVDLGKKTCACRAWQLTGYPCVLAYAAISNLNRDLKDYVSPWLTTIMFCNAYMYTINPLNGSDIQIKNQSKKKKAKEEGKVKVELAQELHLASDSDSEVQMEHDSEVESYEVDFEDDNHRYEDVDQPEVEAEVQGQGEGVVVGVEEHVEVEAHVEALVEVEVQEDEDQATVEGQEGEELIALQDPVGQDDQ